MTLYPNLPHTLPIPSYYPYSLILSLSLYLPPTILILPFYLLLPILSPSYHPHLSSTTSIFLPCSIKTKAKLVQICVANGIPLSEKAVRRGVKDVIAEITQNQGIKMSDLGAEEVAMGSCEKRVFDKVNRLWVLSIGT